MTGFRLGMLALQIVAFVVTLFSYFSVRRDLRYIRKRRAQVDAECDKALATIAQINGRMILVDAITRARDE